MEYGINKTRILAVVGLLIMAMFVTVTTAEAATDLKVTDYNLNALKYYGSWTSYGSGELLRWEGYPAALDASYQRQRMVVSIRATTVADNNGWYWGQCVSLVKALSKNNVATGNWIRGRQVMNNGDLSQGTVIATFRSDGSYDSWGGSTHVAIFDRWHWVYLGNYQWGIDGFYVWDQNYVSSYVVGKHLLKQSGSGNGDADNYYVVRVP